MRYTSVSVLVSTGRADIFVNRVLCKKILLHQNLFSGDGSKTSASGSVYKPTSSLMQKIEERKSKEEQKSILSTPSSVKGKPLVCAHSICA